MPRPQTTRFRRLAQQTIMWLVLAATMGVAAVVDLRLNRLGKPVTLGEMTLRLPSGWIETDEDGEILLRERGDEAVARTLSVRYESPRISLSEIFSGVPRVLKEQTMILEDGTKAQIRVMRRDIARDPFSGFAYYDLTTLALVPTPSKKRVLITVRQISFGGKSDVETNLALLKRVLETVTFQPPE
jgi:hypothetical protein